MLVSISYYSLCDMLKNACFLQVPSRLFEDLKQYLHLHLIQMVSGIMALLITLFMQLLYKYHHFYGIGIMGHLICRYGSHLDHLKVIAHDSMSELLQILQDRKIARALFKKKKL